MKKIFFRKSKKLLLIATFTLCWALYHLAFGSDESSTEELISHQLIKNKESFSQIKPSRHHTHINQNERRAAISYKKQLLGVLNSNKLSTSFFSPDELFKQSNETTTENVNNHDFKCTMSSCFNFSTCSEDKFKIYVYNQSDFPSLPMSPIYSSILTVLSGLSTLTTDPSEACLFILSMDTLDRDKLSPRFIPDLTARIRNLSHWHNGQNHIVFNLYSGSWPSYAENLEFDFGKAVLAKASFSTKSYRPNFDVSFPLFHVNLPFNNSLLLPERDPNLALFTAKKYFLTFKGKRYLHGIGSETRDSLYHFNNKRDIFLQTTCKHGVNWAELKDERCDLDNEMYERFDYDDLLYNSTFCLVPRGRRLGSYRFLESLKAGLNLFNLFNLPWLKPSNRWLKFV
jgi:hypothetical protein